MNQQQSAVPQELAALMALQEGIQAGKVMPTTPQGTPTVAAQMAQTAEQQMAPPAVEDVAQQAGIAAQLQQMQQEQMQQAMMQQAAQQAPQGGVAGLNPQMGGFADGGIVGYNGEAGSVADSTVATVEAESQDPSFRVPMIGGDKELTVSQMRALGYPEIFIKRLLEQTGTPVPSSAAAPVVQATPVAGKPSRNEIERLLDQYQELKSTRPGRATPEEGVAGALEMQAARRRLAGLLGVDPDLLSKQVTQTEDLANRQKELLGRRQAELQERSPKEGLMRRLLSARGRTFGDVMSSMAEAGMGYEEDVRRQIGRLEDLQLQNEGLKIEKVNSLKRMEYATAVGDFPAAMAERQKQLDIDAQLAMNQANAIKDEIRFRVDLEKVDERASRPVRPVGRAGGVRVSRTMVAPDGEIVAVMSDGSVKRTGVTSGDFDKEVAKIITKLTKDRPSFGKLPPDEQRAQAINILMGTEAATARSQSQGTSGAADPLGIRKPV